MMYLSEIYKSSKHKGSYKTVSLEKLVEELREKQINSISNNVRNDFVQSQNGSVKVSPWNIKRVKG